MHPHLPRRILALSIFAALALVLLLATVRACTDDREATRGTTKLVAYGSSYNAWRGIVGPTTTEAPAPEITDTARALDADLPTPTTEPVPRSERPQSYTSDGDNGFPADCIGRYESGNDYGESGGGRFQIIHSTWANYRGYSNAEDAPASVQDAKAQQLWAEAGHQHWAAQRGRCF